MSVSARTAEPKEQSGWGEEAASEKQEAGKEAALVAHRSAHEVDVPGENNAFPKRLGCASSASLCYRPLQLPALPGAEDLANLHRRIRGEARAPPAAAVEKRGCSGRPDPRQRALLLAHFAW